MTDMLLSNTHYVISFGFILEYGKIKVGNTVLSNPSVAVVLGKMRRLATLKDGVCKASLDTIAKECGISVKTVSRCIKALENMRLVKDLTPALKHKPHIYSVKEKEILSAHIEWIKKKVALTKEQESKLNKTLETLDKIEEPVALEKKTKIKKPNIDKRETYSDGLEEVESLYD